MKLICKTLSWILSAALFFPAGCRKKPETASDINGRLPTAAVRLGAAENKREVMVEEVLGTIRSKARATLEAKLSGRIQELPVSLGQFVKKGDLVARLNVAETQARLDQARASLEQAEREWKRTSSLFKGEAVTRSEYDRAESHERLAKAAVEEAAAMLGNGDILAPFAGVVSRKWAEVGDLASPGKPLVEIEDPSTLQLEADVPESAVGQLQLGTVLTARVDGSSGDVQGKISEMAPSADPATRTVRIKVALGPAAGLMPGRFARLLVPIGESECVYVPVSALVQRGQLEIVFVVTNRQARLHLVKSGQRHGDRVAVLSGMNPGETVVVDGAGSLADGQPVEAR